MAGMQKVYAGLAHISNSWISELCINIGVPCNVILKKMMNGRSKTWRRKWIFADYVTETFSTIIYFYLNFYHLRKKIIYNQTLIGVN